MDNDQSRKDNESGERDAEGQTGNNFRLVTRRSEIHVSWSVI